VLGAIGEGLTNKAIARRLDISLHTVKFHLDRCQKAGRSYSHRGRGESVRAPSGRLVSAPVPCPAVAWRSLIAVSLLVFGLAARAAYPEKPIRFIVPSAPGGSVDVLMRILAQQLSAQMGVAFVVENKPGASFVPGTMDIVKAAPDGYTLGYGNIVSLAVNRTLLPTLPYDVEKDLTLVSTACRCSTCSR